MKDWPASTRRPRGPSNVTGVLGVVVAPGERERDAAGNLGVLVVGDVNDDVDDRLRIGVSRVVDEGRSAADGRAGALIEVERLAESDAAEIQVDVGVVDRDEGVGSRVQRPPGRIGAGQDIGIGRRIQSL